PLLWAEALPVQPRALLLGVLALPPAQVHACVGEVVQASRVVEVEMGQQDVAYVARVEAETLDLADGGHLLAEGRIHQEEEVRAEPVAGGCDIAQPEPGVDQYQAVGGLDQQAVAGQLAAFEDPCAAVVHEPPAQRAGRNAVEVMDAHGDPQRTECRSSRDRHQWPVIVVSTGDAALTCLRAGLRSTSAGE